MKTGNEIIGLAKLNLEPESVAYIPECLAVGRRFFCTRKRSRGRCIQGSGETLDSVMRTYNGWRNHAEVSVIEIKDGKVIWHNP